MRTVRTGMTKDYTGQVFNELTVTRYVGRRNKQGAVWVCTCSCGKEVYSKVCLLKNGQVKSCGHLRREKSVLNLPLTSVRGRPVRHPLYAVWNNMIARCYNPKNSRWHRYGGRGIKVCRRWHFYANFYDDNISKWAEGLEIDRRENNEGYWPSNVRFVTRVVNANNTAATARVKARKKMVGRLIVHRLRELSSR